MGNNLRYKLGSNHRNKIGNNIRITLRYNPGKKLRNNTRYNHGNNLRNKLGNNLGNNLRNKIGNNYRSNLRYINLGNNLSGIKKTNNTRNSLNNRRKNLGNNLIKPFIHFLYSNSCVVVFKFVSKWQKSRLVTSQPLLSRFLRIWHTLFVRFLYSKINLSQRLARIYYLVNTIKFVMIYFVNIWFL